MRKENEKAKRRTIQGLDIDASLLEFFCIFFYHCVLWHYGLLHLFLLQQGHLKRVTKRKSLVTAPYSLNNYEDPDIHT